MTRTLSRMLARVVLLLGVAPLAAQAQQGTTVTGRVTNATAAPIEAVSVSIPALAVGAVTNADGRFSFTVPAAKVSGQSVSLIARRIGFTPVTHSVVLLAGSTITSDFTLPTATTQLQGVVVTALGQVVEKATLGTAQQQLNTQELNTTVSTNFLNQLQGKVSGVSIVGNGTQGGSTSINIRGYTSISGNNQPLFIVDGIPISNANRGTDQAGGSMVSSKDFGSALQDINPNDIATLTVLKGPNAAALYGSRAANGAIIITTKRGGARNSGMDVSSSITFDKATLLPDFQNQYGQGAGGEFAWVNGAGGLDGNDQSYGPKLDGRTTGCLFIADDDPRYTAPHVYDPTSQCTQFTSPAAGAPWIAHPDNVSSFFNTGKTSDITVGFSGGTDRSSSRISVNGQNVEGVVPNEYLRRLGGIASGSLKATDKLTIDGSINYVHNSGVNRPGQGYSGGIMEGLYVWFGRQVDMDALKQGYQQSATSNNGPATREFNWNYLFHNNPYFMQYSNPESDQRDRAIASGSATYQFTDWLSGMVRTGTDTYRYNINADYAQGNIELNNGANTVNPQYAGAFQNVADLYTENNTDLLLTAHRDLTSKFNLTANVGGNRRYSNESTNSLTVNGITVAGIYNASNAALSPVNSQSITRRAVNSTYGSAAITYNGFWTVEGTARNDWSSTLPQANNSYFYPSINTSIVLTDALPMLKSNTLSYLKIRGGTARVGNDAPAYSLYTTYAGNASKFNGQPQFSLGNALQNPDLKPETTVSNEGGVEIGLWDSRVSVDASLYDKYTTDEITQVAVPPSTGYASKLINAGKVDNHGFEALITVEPIRSPNFGWTSTFNYSRNHAKVISLNPGLTTIVFGSFQGVVQSEARAGDNFGTIRGYSIKRDVATGLPLLTDDGLYQASDTLEVLGSYQPDWTGGWTNSIHFRRFTLNTTLDIRRGGKLFSGTNYYGQATGTLASTMTGREVDWNNPGIVINGIIESTGAMNTADNTRTTEEYFQSIAYNNISSPYVYDDSYLKLREVRIGWDVPETLSRGMGAYAVNLALVGRNLWTHSNVPNIDPEISYNTTSNQGLEYAGLPAARSFGFAVRFTP